jgi:formiminotetrahydrofolate cyclodeaminase
MWIANRQEPAIGGGGGSFAAETSYIGIALTKMMPEV